MAKYAFAGVDAIQFSAVSPEPLKSVSGCDDRRTLLIKEHYTLVDIDIVRKVHRQQDRPDRGYVTIVAIRKDRTVSVVSTFLKEERILQHLEECTAKAVEMLNVTNDDHAGESEGRYEI